MDKSSGSFALLPRNGAAPRLHPHRRPLIHSATRIIRYLAVSCSLVAFPTTGLVCLSLFSSALHGTMCSEEANRVDDHEYTS
jgi:hypothetical protein